AIMQSLKTQYGLSGSVHEGKLLVPEVAGGAPLVRFLDALDASGSDGPFAQKLIELHNRVGDAQRAVVQHSGAALSGLTIDGKLGPNEGLAKILPELLRKMRTERAVASGEEANKQLADERHLLSGRNFLSFRKDV